MLHDAFLIARLKARETRTTACRWFHIAGTDPSRDRSFSLRMYQIYVSVMVAAALAAIWLAAIAQVEVIAASFSVGAAEAVVRGLGLAAAVLFGVSCFKALRGGPFSFSDADVAFLLTGPVRLQLVLVADLRSLGSGGACLRGDSARDRLGDVFGSRFADLDLLGGPSDGGADTVLRFRCGSNAVWRPQGGGMRMGGVRFRGRNRGGGDDRTASAPSCGVRGGA